MRTVRGFERPAVQWTFVTLALVLTVLVVALSATVWRTNAAVREIRASQLNERRERDQLQAQLARERAAREALALELARLRGGNSARSTAQGPPTVTLDPLRGRDATPPPPTMTPPAATQIVELRLVLPRGADPQLAPYELTVRDWVTGQVRLTRGGLTSTPIAGGHAVRAYVAGDVFAAGSHEVILRSKDSEIATYEITVK